MAIPNFNFKAKLTYLFYISKVFCDCVQKMFECNCYLTKHQKGISRVRQQTMRLYLYCYALKKQLPVQIFVIYNNAAKAMYV